MRWPAKALQVEGSEVSPPGLVEKPGPERAVLVGLDRPEAGGRWAGRASMEELARLVATAGAVRVGELAQRLRSPHPHMYLGRGKVQELAALCDQLAPDLVVFDDELAPAQQRFLEESLGGRKVIDRTALILDIFGRRAHSHEGRLQVELAQHEYLLPRLAGQWTHLERLGGGIGTRGPGETQLETDRRLIRSRIQRLKRELEAVRRHRALYRQRRRASAVPVVALVGYTNAGKSTLLNALTSAEVFTEDLLFATLDPTTRRLRLPSGRAVLLTDTVGFIQKLPPTVVAAFRATLEELEEADVLLHVLDVSHPDVPQQRQVVEQTLRRLGLDTKPRLLVLNKVDRLGIPPHDLVPRAEAGGAPVHDPARPFVWPEHLGQEEPWVGVSALRGWGLEGLQRAIQEALETDMVELRACIPFDRGDLLRRAQEVGSLHSTRHLATGTLVQGQIPRHLAPLFAPYTAGRGRGGAERGGSPAAVSS